MDCPVPDEAYAAEEPSRMDGIKVGAATAGAAFLAGGLGLARLDDAPPAAKENPNVGYGRPEVAGEPLLPT